MSRTCSRRGRLRALLAERLRGTRREWHPQRVPFLGPPSHRATVPSARGGCLQVPAGHRSIRPCFAIIIKTANASHFQRKTKKPKGRSSTKYILVFVLCGVGRSGQIVGGHTILRETESSERHRGTYRTPTMGWALGNETARR